jgi:hypothetical protein
VSYTTSTHVTDEWDYLSLLSPEARERYDLWKEGKLPRARPVVAPKPVKAVKVKHDGAGRPKIDRDMVDMIRLRLSKGISPRKISQEVGVNHVTIYKMKNGTWRNGR